MKSLKISIAGYVFKLNIDNSFLYSILKERYSDFISREKEDVTMNFYFKADKRVYYVKRSEFKKGIIIFKTNCQDMCKIIHNDFYGFENFLASVTYYWLFRKNVLPLHASGIVKNKKAYVFCGKAGSGKTTIAKLLEKQGGQILNDNEILIRNMNSKFMIFSGPFKRRNLKPKNTSAQLAAIFFLKKKGFKRISKLEGDETFKCLLVNHYIPKLSYQNEEDVRTLFKICSKIARSIACYELLFKLDENMWRDIDATTHSSD